MKETFINYNVSGDYYKLATRQKKNSKLAYSTFNSHQIYPICVVNVITVLANACLASKHSYSN